MEVEAAGAAVAEPGTVVLLKLEWFLYRERSATHSHVPVRSENNTNKPWIYFFYHLGSWLDLLQPLYDQN